jgi:SAM-dependent methyltransferase
MGCRLTRSSEIEKLKCRKIIRRLYSEIWEVIRYIMPFVYHMRSYWKASKKMGDYEAERARLFEQLIEDSVDRKCLQIGVRNEKYSAHWISVDLFDMSEYIDYHYDVHDLKFTDNTFDIIVCNAILEHVENPEGAVRELYRVLKYDGLIWIEIPFNQPCHPSPNDYWRVSPAGIKIWMKDFIKIASGHFKIDRSSIYNGVYYYGILSPVLKCDFCRSSGQAS